MTPLDRAARALAETDPQGRGMQYWRDYVPDARAVLEAIREPSGEMARAGEFAAYSHPDDGPDLCISEGDARDVWKRMIDAALSEKPE